MWGGGILMGRGIEGGGAGGGLIGNWRFVFSLQLSNMWFIKLTSGVSIYKRQRGTEDGSDTSVSSSSQEEGNSQDSDESDGEKVERKARKKEKKAEAARQAERRRSKVVKLNKLSAISGGGGGSGSKNVECFRCGEMGHRRSECEKWGSGKRGASEKGRDGGK